MAISKSKTGRIAIIGASGYGGLQLVKLINEHPNFEISTLNGERSAGKSWNEINPFMKILGDKKITKSNIDEIAHDSDLEGSELAYPSQDSIVEAIFHDP